MSKEEKDREKQYQLDDDKRTVKSYLTLRNNGPRHAAAIDGIRSEAEAVKALDDRNDALPRKATRITARKSTRGGKRR